VIVVFAAIILRTVVRSEEFREWRAKHRRGKAWRGCASAKSARSSVPI